MFSKALIKSVGLFLQLVNIASGGASAAPDSPGQTITRANNCPNGAYCWIPGGRPSPDLLSQLERAGHQGGEYFYYVGRARHLHGVIPGALTTWTEGGTHFWIAYQDQEFDKGKGDFEVLQFTPGTLSWMEMADGNLPESPIIGGTYPDTWENMYFCRAKFGYAIFIGNVRRGGNCTIPYAGISHYYNTGYEVLALNEYGRFVVEETSASSSDPQIEGNISPDTTDENNNNNKIPEFRSHQFVVANKGSGSGGFRMKGTTGMSVFCILLFSVMMMTMGCSTSAWPILLAEA